MRAVIGTIAALWVGLAGWAAAENGPVVVELYTSQGCSSCPPADKMLGELAKRDDVIALALHVDYWDYIGWKDMFADPAYTTRQKGYARAAGKRTIYTPQMIVGGRDHVVGNKPMQLAKLIEDHGDAREPVTLRVSRQGDQVVVEARATEPFEGSALIQLVRFIPKETVSIRRGENAGRTIDYYNIVSELTEIGTWDGSGTYRVSAPLTGDDQAAILVQRANYGAMLAAARVR